MSKIFKTMVATAVVSAAGCLMIPAIAADAPAAVDSTKLSTGLSPLAQLLQLMDTDKNGKVSKDEFMSFMQAEFDFADKNHDGQLDPVELKNFVHQLSHPSSGTPRIRK
jgi:hypothetical protein